MPAIQIRGVPEDLHRELRARAAALGLSLSDYLLNELEEIIRQPSIAEVVARIEAQEPARVTTQQIVAAVRSGRDR